MPRSLSWYHDRLANTRTPGVDANETLYGHFNQTLLDCVGFISKCSFAKLTCEFTVGPPVFPINYNPVNTAPFV